MISVVKDHLVFMSEIPYTDDFVQKSLCGEGLPANMTRDGQILQAQSHLQVPGVLDHSRVHTFLVVGLCKLGTTFCVNFEQQRLRYQCLYH